jgi:hypothetical protein
MERRTTWWSRWGCYVYGCGALIAVGVVGFILLVQAFKNSFIDCSPAERAAVAGQQVQTLDARHPAVEQHLSIHINAEALPADLPRDRVTLTVELKPTPATVGPAIPDPPGSLAKPVESAVQMTFLREDAGIVEGRVGNPETVTDIRGPRATHVITLGCVPGQPCDREYRVTFTIADAGVSNDVPPVALAWTTRLAVDYRGMAYSQCGTPPLAQVSMQGDRPVVAQAGSVLQERLSTASEDSPLVARHVLVEFEPAATRPFQPAPLVAYARVNVGGSHIPYGAWELRARALVDGSAVPLVDGAVPSTLGRPREGAIDFPILVGCTTDATCSRGYWLIFRSEVLRGPLVEPPTNVGEFTWNLEATVRNAGGTGLSAAPHLTLSVDDMASGIQNLPTFESDTAELVIDHWGERRAVDINFDIATRPASTNGLDPLAASEAIVRVRGDAEYISTHLEGDGANSGRTFISGSAYEYTHVAHPFDRCPPQGPCKVAVRLVMEPYDLYARTPPNGTGRLNVSVTLLGAQPDTLIVMGRPFELPGYSQAASSPVLTIGIGVIVLMALLWFGRYAWRRLNYRAPPSP